MTTETEEIAARLTDAQKATVLAMSAEAHALGCSEQTALRLSVAKSTRPALTEIAGGVRLPHNRLRLTREGLAVQAELIRAGWTRAARLPGIHTGATDHAR